MNISKSFLVVALVMSTVACKSNSTSSAEQPNNNLPSSNSSGNQGGSSSNTSANTPNEWIRAHNALRSKYGVGNLQWSSAIAKSAQAFADTCPNGHDQKTKYGENLAWASYNRTPTTVVNRWYNEASNYDYAKPGFAGNTGHFTQIVWKSTTKLGCGYKNNCTNGYSHVVVCQYNPAGNVMGRFPQNVLPKR